MNLMLKARKLIQETQQKSLKSSKIVRSALTSAKQPFTNQSSHLVSSIFKPGISNKTDDFWILDLGPLLITYALISNVFLILKILKLFPPPFPMETIVTQEL
jgi:hypothetical protein